MLATMKNEYNKLSDIERFITDGRLTEPSNGKRFEWREMIEEVKKLGRPLKEEETKKFRNSDRHNYFEVGNGSRHTLLSTWDDGYTAHPK